MSTSRKQTVSLRIIVQHVIKQQETKIGCHARSAKSGFLLIKDEAYKVIQQLDSCHWYCRSCNAGVGKLLPTLVCLADKIGVLEEKITKVDRPTDLEKSRGRVVSLSNEISKNKTTTEERFTKTDSEINQLKADVSCKV